MYKLLKLQPRRFCQTNYYEVLGVQRNAKQEDIQKAFKQKLQNFSFNLNSQSPKEEDKPKINELLQAFGVLSLENEKISYDTKLDLPQKTNSALNELTDQVYINSVEKMKKMQQNELNFNDFDRYNGGYPNLLSLSRGNALRPPGNFRDVQTEPLCFDSQSVIDFKVTKADAEEFSVYQKFDQYAYEQPRSWLKLEKFQSIFYFVIYSKFRNYIFNFLKSRKKKKQIHKQTQKKISKQEKLNDQK